MAAMLASSVIPMLMQPEVRKGMGKLAKYLLIFGGLGVGILAFILISKKFNPLKAISGWLKKSVTGVQKGVMQGITGIQKDLQKGVVGFQKDVAKGWTGFQKDVAKGVSGFQKDVGKGVSGFQKDVAKGWTGFWGDVGKGVSGLQKDVAEKLGIQSEKRKEIRRVSKPIVREIEKLRKVRELAGQPIGERLLAAEAMFKSVKRKPVIRIEKQMDRAFWGGSR